MKFLEDSKNKTILRLRMLVNTAPEICAAVASSTVLLSCKLTENSPQMPVLPNLRSLGGIHKRDQAKISPKSAQFNTKIGLS